MELGLGSPPQVRGKRRSNTRYRQVGRITPAGAGKTVQYGNAQRRKQDHPRRCGENAFLVFGFSFPSGSPPQVRGKLMSVHTPMPRFRITPAGAGKTISVTKLQALMRDHPRRCGENFCDSFPHHPCRGSPPQVRGKLPPLSQICRHDKDHPRRCGENQNFPQAHRSISGSPPQVRGKLTEFRHPPCSPRITPAGAGKTLKRSFRNQPFCS